MTLATSTPGWKRDEAAKVLRNLTDWQATNMSCYGREVIHAALGDNEEHDMAREGYEERSFMVYTKVGPALDTLRKEESSSQS